MLRMKDEAEKDNKGVAIMNGKFIGPPMVATAKKILQKAQLIENK
jgi:citrate lyase subunit beta/citryl-CoA lyase